MAILIIIIIIRSDSKSVVVLVCFQKFNFCTTVFVKSFWKGRSNWTGFRTTERKHGWSDPSRGPEHPLSSRMQEQPQSLVDQEQP